MGCFWPLYIMFVLKRTRELYLIALKVDAKFEGKLTCTYQRMFESLKFGTFIGFFYPKWKMYNFKIYRAVMCHKNEEWCKI